MTDDLKDLAKKFPAEKPVIDSDLSELAKQFPLKKKDFSIGDPLQYLEGVASSGSGNQSSSPSLDSNIAEVSGAAADEILADMPVAGEQNPLILAAEKVSLPKIPQPHVEKPQTGQVKFAQPLQDLQTEQNRLNLPDNVKKVSAFKYAEQGKYDVSNQILNTIQDDKDGYVYELKAHNLMANGDLNGAKEFLTTAIDKNPNNPRLYPQLAIVSAKLNDAKTANEAADKYIFETGGNANGKEDVAKSLSDVYAIKGDKKKSDYWAMTARDIREDYLKNEYGKTIVGLTDKIQQGLQTLMRPVEIPATMLVEGAKTISQAGDEMDAGANIFKTVLPKVASGAIDMYFGALMSTPAGMAFNSVLEAGNLVGANELTDWAFAPVSKILAMNGVDETKLGEWGKFGVKAGNIVPFMAFMSGKGVIAKKLKNKEPLTAEEVKQVDEIIASAVPEEYVKNPIEFKPTDQATKDQIDKQVLDNQQRLNIPKTPEVFISPETDNIISKIDKGEPVTNQFLNDASTRLYDEYKRLQSMKESTTRQHTIEQIDGAMKDLGDNIEKLETIRQQQTETGEFIPKRLENNDIPTIIKQVDAAISEAKTAEELKAFQTETTEPTYRVNGELLKSPDEVISKVQELKDKGVSPDNIEIDIRNDIDGASRVKAETTTPKENTPQVQEKPIVDGSSTEVLTENPIINEKGNEEGQQGREVLSEPATEKTGGEIPPVSTETANIPELKVEPKQEGVQNATGNGKGINEGSQQEGINGETQGGVHLRDNEKNRVETKQGEETTNPPVEKKVKAKFQLLADKLRQAKIQEGLNDPTTLGISDTKLWNDALETAANILETTGDFAQALADGMAMLKSKEDKDKFKTYFDEFKPEELSKARIEDTEKMRQEAGFGESTRKKIGSIDENREQAIREIEKGVDIQPIINRAMGNEGINPLEQAILSEYLLGLREKATKDPSPDNVARYRLAIMANEQAGSTASGVMNARRVEIKPEESIADAIIDAERTLGVDKLTPEQEAKTKAWFEEHDKKTKELEERLKKAEEENLKLRAEKERKIRAKGTRKTKEQFTKERDEIIARAKEKWTNVTRGGGVTMASVIPVPYAQHLYAIAPEVKALFNLYAQDASFKLKDIIDKIKVDFGFKEMTDTDVLAMIAGDYDVRPGKNKTDIAINIEGLRQEAKELLTLEKLLQGIDDKPLTAKKNKQISDTKKKINEIRKANNKKPIPDEETKTAARLKAYRTKLTNEKAQLQKELAGAPSKPKPQKLILDPETKKLKDEVITLRQIRRADLLMEKYNALSSWEKFKQQAVKVATGTSKALTATGDLSVSLLQLGAAAFVHPFKWSRSFVKSIDFAKSETKHRTWIYEQSKTREYAIMKEAGLSLPDVIHGKLLSTEELLSSDIIDKIPILGKALKINGKGYGGITKAAQRQFIGMGDALRIELGKAIIDRFEGKGMTFENNKDAYKAAVEWANTLTSRSKGGVATERTLQALGNVLWAPKMYYSQMKFLTAPLNKQFMFTHPEVTKMVAGDWAKYMGISAAVLGLSKLMGADIELDASSKDAFTIRVGNMRFGLPGGFAQWIVIPYQIITGEQKSTVSGKKKYVGEGYPKRTRADIFQRAIRGKFSPMIALGADLFTEETFMGEDLSVGKEVAQYMVPMAWRNYYTSFRDEGGVKGGLLGTAGILGLPVRSYPNTGSYPTEPLAGRNINALGESTKNYDKDAWNTLNKYHINVKPPNKSKLQQPDEENIENVKINDEQYDKFVKIRGDAIIELSKYVKDVLPDLRERHINAILKMQLADGTHPIKDRKDAEQMLDNFFIPDEVSKAVQKITTRAKTVAIGKKPYTQKQIDISRSIEEYTNKMEGK